MLKLQALAIAEKSLMHMCLKMYFKEIKSFEEKVKFRLAQKKIPTFGMLHQRMCENF